MLPTVSPTPSPTASPTPKPTPTAKATPTVSPTPRRTSSPRPRSTFSVAPGSTDNPVTATFGVGGVTPESPSPSVDPKESSSSSGLGDHVTLLLALVLGAAVLLGVGGVVGLYLTRHHHEH